MPSAALPRRVGYFESNAPLAVSQVPDDPSTWEYTAEMVFHSATGYILRIKAGSRTDWGSIPRLASWLIGKMTGAAACGGHDECWRNKVPAGELTYREADALLEEMLAALDVQATRRQDRIPAPTRWLFWAAVRLASITTRPGGAQDAWRDMPRLVAITLPGLLLVAPAAPLLIPMALFWVVNRLAQHEWHERPDDDRTREAD